MAQDPHRSFKFSYPTMCIVTFWSRLFWVILLLGSSLIFLALSKTVFKIFLTQIEKNRGQFFKNILIKNVINTNVETISYEN